jgi:hypothetical protein
VHALRRIHLSLRPEGVLLDLHPQPEPAGVEVWHSGRVERLGHVGQKDDVRDILEARVRMAQVETDGWYVTQRQEFFDLITHSPTPSDWQECQAREGYSCELSEELLASAHELVATTGGEFIVREPIRASLLRRLPRSEATTPATVRPTRSSDWREHPPRARRKPQPRPESR